MTQQSAPHSARTRIAVIGGGISGLAAARALAADPTHEVVVLEGAPQLGGKLRTASVAGISVDVGAEAMLSRRPEGVALARAVGREVVHPTSATSRIWSRGSLRPMPRSLMGVPMDLPGLAASGLLTAAGLAAVAAEATMPAEELSGDVSVGDLVGRRLGGEVVDRLVEPLLGGVYAGHARLISARAAAPQLLALLARGSLVEQAALLPTSTAPVFAGLVGGMGQLPQAVVDRAAADSTGFEVQCSTAVRAVTRTGEGFSLEVGSAAAPKHLVFDRVVLATPVGATAKLLASLAPVASSLLGRVELASVVVVTLAFRSADLAGLDLLDGSVSGFLVPPEERRRIKASTFSFAKWDWVRSAGRGALDGGDVVHLRTSLGRHREALGVQASDEELVAWSLADLADATGCRAHPVDQHVQRWGGGLPQYAVGHLDLVAAVRADVARVPGLAVCGAAYDGVGVPACIASAERAALDVLRSGRS